MAAYCFDTSVLIECWSRSYPPDVFPGLWVKLDELISQQEVLCADEVRIELERQEDDLATWINARPHLFVPLDDAIQRATSEVLARHPLLMKATKNRNGADPFVIATALVRGLTVVTEEQGGTDTKPKIPSVCAALRVPCVNVLSFIRDQGWTFA
jgi:predicted nucleic acid-binding protein